MKIKKLNTDIVNIKFQAKSYYIFTIISIIGLLITAGIYLQNNNGISIKKYRFYNEQSFYNNVISSKTLHKDIYKNIMAFQPILTKGLKACVKDGEEYKILENPYQNLDKWTDQLAKTEDGKIWKWVPRFAYRIEYYKDNRLVGYFTDKYYKENNGLFQITTEADFRKIDKDSYKFAYVSPYSAEAQHEEYTIHDAFYKQYVENGVVKEYNINGFWAEVTPNIYENKEISEITKRINETNNLDKSLSNMSLINPIEFNALYTYNIGMENHFFDNTNINKELLSAYLDNNSTNLNNTGKLIKEINKNQNIINREMISDVIKYNVSETDSSEENLKLLNKRNEIYHDAFYQTAGILEKDKKNKYIDKTKFVTGEFNYLVGNINSNNKEDVIENTKLDAIYNYGQKNGVAGRRVIYIKEQLVNDLINIKIEKNDNDVKLIGSNNNEIESADLKIPRGKILNIQELYIVAKKEGYIFTGWSINIFGEPQYENITIYPVFVKKEDVQDKIKTLHISYKNFKTNVNENYRDIEYIKNMPFNQYIPMEINGSYIIWNREIIKIMYTSNSNITELFGKLRNDAKVVKYYMNKEQSGFFEEEIVIEKNNKYQVKAKASKILQIPKGKEFISWDDDLKEDSEINSNLEISPIFRDRKDLKVNGLKVYLDYDGAENKKNDTFYIEKNSTLENNQDIKKYLLNFKFEKLNYRIPEEVNKRFKLKENDDYVEYNLNNQITKDIVLKLQWEPLKLKVKYMKYPKGEFKNEVIYEKEFNAGTELPNPPTYNEGLLKTYFNESIKQNVTYDGWTPYIQNISNWDPKIGKWTKYENGQNIINEDFQNLNNYNLIYYPIYKIKDSGYEKVKVKFNFNAPLNEITFDRPYEASNIYKDTEILKGNSFPTIAYRDYPKRIGYDFIGFLPDISRILNEDTVFVGQWKKKEIVFPVVEPEKNNNSNIIPNNNDNEREDDYRKGYNQGQEDKKNKKQKSKLYGRSEKYRQGYEAGYNSWKEFTILDEEEKSNNIESRLDNRNISGESKEKTPYAGVNNNNILFIGAFFTSIATYSITKYIKINAIIKRNSMIF